MPLRRKSNLSRSSIRSKRARQSRSQENEEHREARLATLRHYYHESLSAETFEEREVRLARDRERRAFYRASEATPQREARQIADQERHTLSRDSETYTQREARLEADRERHTISRESETFTQREARLTADREYHAISRDSETFTQREARLTADREYHAISRDSETFTQREARLTADREYHAISRDSETFTQREARLTADREYHAISRDSETFTQREARLTADREYHAISRDSETFTQREARLTADREYHAISRDSETFTQREARLTADREYHAISRQSETLTQREARLTADRERHAISRESETFTQREVRLDVDRERHNESRASETEEQRAIRLESARVYFERIQRERDDFQTTERLRIEEIRRAESEAERETRLDGDRMRHSLNRMTVSASSDIEDENVTNDSLPWVNIQRSGFSYTPSISYATFSNIGRMNENCNYCLAFKWNKESNGLCCSNGKTHLDTFSIEPPEPLKSLLDGEHPHSKNFLECIRSYNSAFQMTSFGAKQIVEGPFMPTFKVLGQVYHLIGSLLAEDNPKFLQIYFVSDYNEQASVRRQLFPSLNAIVVTELQNMLNELNPIVRNFKTALEDIPPGQLNDYKIVVSADRRPPAEHRGRYNAPTANEVAVVLIDQECDKRDIVLRTHDDRLQRISETHRSYDALQYPLIFCRGEDGYYFNIPQVDPITRAPNLNKKTSALQFYSYLLQVRRDQFIHLQRFRGLFSQFIVDMYAKIETERLVYIRTNQRRLRAENYVDLRDAMQRDTSAEELGRMVILPSSFTGSPRYMHQRTQDAFCYVRKYGRPDLFITFTTNPKWDDITRELLPGQASHDRHDVIARVFHLKLKLMMDLLSKENVFGAALCYMYSVEWQKRGLPHAHILLWLVEKVRPCDVDHLIKAEIPNPDEDPTLHNIVKAHMVHGPCGALNNSSPCMKNGSCTKRYPRSLVSQTVTGEDGDPKYRRRSCEEGGFTTDIRVRGQQITVDNRWIVPYSPVLSKTFNAHINVEMCNSVESIKYICKYVNKGSDQATMALTRNDRDEVTKFQSGRYISSSEAVWRTLSFSIHERHPPVVHLDVHLEGGQRIYFDTENVVQRLENPRQTTLLAFFRLCETDDFAKTLLYDEVPAYYTYDKQRGVFNRRKRGSPVDGFLGVFKEHVIGRVYNIHPNNAECFYLRLLLHTVRGPSSFEALNVVDGIQHSTFQAACRARHLLDDDQHWDNALAEACVSDSPRRLRHLFSVMLVFCALSDAKQLWEKYHNQLAEDFCRQLQQNHVGGDLHNARDTILNQCLNELQDIVVSIGGNTLSSYGLPEPTVLQERGNREYISETTYDQNELIAALQNDLPALTDEQRAVFEAVINSASNSLGQMYFLDAPGGTGKTFLTKVILAQIRSQNRIALAVASSGIAATLLPGAKTAHSMFKIPIQLDNIERPVCDISRNSDKARVLADCCLIVWDECTMTHRKAVESVDRSLRDICRNDQPMGGITVLFCGDFRQTLPVVPRGTKADEISACLKSSYLWQKITKIHLTVNMRARRGGNPNAQDFSDLLLKIGEGTFPEEGGLIKLPDNLCQVIPTREELIAAVYDNISHITHRDDSWLCERAILSPRNDQATEINDLIMDHIAGEEMTYQSINRVVDPNETTTYPIEFLNSLGGPGLPAHIIKLKVGVPIILLRNLSPPKLCNGTRLKVTSLQRNVIEADILTGCGAGERVFIPRIPLIPNNYPFRFKRVQFPVSVCFGMTINKAQGQTLAIAGVNLSADCFSHGQLYVALSRVSSANSLFVLAAGSKTPNVVYKEVL